MAFSTKLVLHVPIQRSGKITLVATVMMLALVALAGLIGNAGHTSNQKISTQNAADAVAFSSALWMARGMNALTATNHMLGEATAMAAVHEALAGPELDAGIKRNTNENRTHNRHIRNFRKAAPVGTPVPSPFGYTPQPVRSIDQNIVKVVTNRTSPTQGEMTAFATIYDARMTLKRELTLLLSVKSFADVGFFVPPPWGYATAAISYGVHLGATSQIVLIGKEWIVLDVLEAVAKLFQPAKRIIESQLIPTLAAHAEFVAGYKRVQVNWARASLTAPSNVPWRNWPPAIRSKLPLFRLPINCDCPLSRNRSPISKAKRARMPTAGDATNLPHP